MKRVLKRLAYGAGAPVVGAAFVALGGFAASEVMIRMPPRPGPTPAIVAANDPGAVERGRRLATVSGCHDCHGKDLSGKLFHDDPAMVRAWAPNLTLAAAQQSDAQLARAIRHGVAADGRPLWIMPSSAFSKFSDAETADLLAYLRSVPPTGARQPRLQVGPVGRLAVLLGKFHSEPATLKANGGLDLPDLGPEHAQGRAVARACVECHGPELKGSALVKSPDLAIAGAYDLNDFERLLRTGIAAGDRKLGLMSEIAPARFNVLSHEEIAALHAYLRARAEQAS
ncbi:c-type cytochrome [Phenylobacterium hankyongense]|nr:c-type cytochrome [Phenylobacterium hankyongense]